MAQPSTKQRLTEFVNLNRRAEAETLLLAIGLHQALAGAEPDSVLSTAVLTRRAEDRLHVDRMALRSTVLAAARCYGSLSHIRGESDAIQSVRAQIWSACFGATLRHAVALQYVIHQHDVLILGETGTGKELAAQAFLTATPGDPNGEPPPSSTVNAAEVPESLIESELFGHVKGAFTGATRSRAGRIRSANGGCFFLDEVGDLPTVLQVKLLRVIESDEVNPVGSDETFPVSVRFVAATHRDLREMVSDGSFRRDLYQRLAGHVIHLPPLRERPQDIPHIGMGLIGAHPVFASERDRIEAWLNSREAQTHDWPGNVRELHNALRNMMLGLPPALTPRDPGKALSAADGDVPAAVLQNRATLAQVRDWYLHRVLQSTNQNLSAAARVLGVDRTTVRRLSKP